MSKGLPQTTHIAILGKKGTGKDTLAQDLIHDLLDEGYQSVYSNVQMYEPHNSHPWNELHTKDCLKEHKLANLHIVRYLRMLRGARNSIVYISELSKAIPSRRVGHQQTEVYNLIQETMNRLRKRNCPFIYSDQWRRGADIMIRTNVDRIMLPALDQTLLQQDGNQPLTYGTFKPRGVEFAEMEMPQGELTFMSSKRPLNLLFQLFKTEEIIPLTYNPPFNVDRWTNAFLLWCTKHGYIVMGMKDSTVKNVVNLYEVRKNAYISGIERSAVLGALKVSGKI